ncbi:hypothetical protein F2P81_020848 [Scophthalmus maximus]|uniref:Uncharacterized protein n=1 Tax=Scophthalmus maximus TaxID=52904 RepID=A0A6A4S4P7_SCOMX|nr:hypothetical protein F2P81_020848 [Scophthalmus maximus]
MYTGRTGITKVNRLTGYGTQTGARTRAPRTGEGGQNLHGLIVERACFCNKKRKRRRKGGCFRCSRNQTTTDTREDGTARRDRSYRVHTHRASRFPPLTSTNRRVRSRFVGACVCRGGGGHDDDDVAPR